MGQFSVGELTEKIMGIGQKIRKWFNTCMIEKNAAVVEEMIRHNKRYGRISDPGSRAWFVLGLYFKYGIMHKNPLQEFEKGICRLPFPETGNLRQVSLEEMLRRLKKAEVVVFDLWDVLVYMGLDSYQTEALCECELLSVGMSAFLLENCILVNPFVRKLWDALQEEGKRLFIYNNSVCDDRIAEQIIKKYQYEGGLYREKIDGAVHITTQKRSDEDVLYNNVNQLGNPYRTYYEYNAVTNLTDRIVNLLLHGENREKTVFYEYGLMCGGILTCGFCGWLNELADRKNIELFLFVARDGDIMYRVYQKYYAKHDSAYLQFSRFASFELIFEEYPEEYIDKNIKPRMERKGCDNSIGKILRECGLEFVESYLPKETLTGTDILNRDNYDFFKSFLLKHRREIAEKFQVSCKAAEQYYTRVCGNHKKICVVDLGWHGKSILYLKHFMERKCGMEVQITGAMIGASGDTVTQDYIRRGLFDTYVFENDRWRSQSSRNGDTMSDREIICTEALYSSVNDTLLRYKLGENGETVFVYGKKNENVFAIREIHGGILDFAQMFAEMQNQFKLRVMPRDAYTPLSYMLKNKKFLDLIYGNYVEEAGALNGFT